jgi:hypothetical protein
VETHLLGKLAGLAGEPGFNVGDIKAEFARSKTHYAVAEMTVGQLSKMLAYTQDEARIVRELGLMDSATYMQLDEGLRFDGSIVRGLHGWSSSSPQSFSSCGGRCARCQAPYYLHDTCYAP